MTALRVFPVRRRWRRGRRRRAVRARAGAVYTGTEDGSIFRVSHDGQRIERVARTQGRPLGLAGPRRPAAGL
ncbi:MAG: hypothetical protein R2731_03640 [Nocardioides sp.]